MADGDLALEPVTEGEESAKLQETIDEVQQSPRENGQQSPRENGSTAEEVYLDEKNSEEDGAEMTECKVKELPDPSALNMRSFAVTGLRQPGGWKNNDQLFELFTGCESFSMSFAPAAKPGGQKTGYATLVFMDAHTAREAYRSAELIRIYDRPLTLEAAAEFYLPLPPAVRFFELPTEEFDRARTIFALHLPSSCSGVNDPLLTSIFGVGQLQHGEFLGMSDGRDLQAKLTLLSAEAVQEAREYADGMELNDDEQQTVLKVMLCAEYETFVGEAMRPLPFLTREQEMMRQKEIGESLNGAAEASTADGETAVFNEEAEAAAGPSDEHIIAAINEHIHRERINWADLNEKEDIYQVLDVISAQFRGLPDSMLKPCMLEVFNRHLSETAVGWMRQHLDALIKLWKTEVQNDHLFERPTRIKLAARVLSPTPEPRKRRAAGGAERRNELKTRMGLGAFLSHARQTIQTEKGEMDVEEDVHGNFTVGGEELGWESWEKLMQTSSSSKVDALPVKAKEEPRMPRILTQEERDKIRYEKRMAAKARRKARKAEKLATMREGLDDGDEDHSEGEQENVEPVALASSKELEDGEVDSGDEKRRASKRAKVAKSSSSSGSSSSSSSDDDTGSGAALGSRQRRRERRKNEQRQRGSSSRTPAIRLPPLVKELFEHRHELVKALSAEHRTAFAQILHRVMNEPLAMTLAQREEMLKKMAMLVR